MAKADGSVIINTLIDTKGFNKFVADAKGQFKSLAASASKLAGTIGVAFSVGAIIQFGKEGSEAARLYSDALVGLQSILEGQGRSFSEAKQFIEEYTKDGLIPATNAITAYKNLAMRGYDDSQIKQVMVALKDASAYGRQASYSMGQAVESATEGLKNENSILVDNAGVTKNVAKMWDEYAKSIGTTANNLTQQQKIQAEVTGILEESKYQTGDAAKVAGTLSGQLQQLSFGFNNLKIAVGNIINPIVQSFLPAINAAITKVTQFSNTIAAAVNAFFGTKMGEFSNSLESVSDGYNDGADGAEEFAKETEKAGKAAKKALAGFDEISKLSDSTGTETSALDIINSSGTTAESNIPVSFDVDTSSLNSITKSFEKIREALNGILVLVSLVGAGIVAWKILDAVTAGVTLKATFAALKPTLTNIGSMLLTLAGSVLLIKGYLGGWVNGVGWGELLTTLSGIALIIGGITLKFGPFGTAIATVASGIALVVLGVKDFIKNGPSIENTILIIGGAIAVAVGLATAGLSVVVSAIVAAVTAVAAFTAAILLEEEAIMSTEEAQKNLTAAKQAAIDAENDYISAVDAADSALERLKKAEEAAGITGEELYAQVQSGTLDYADMTAAQKELYKAYLNNEEKQKTLTNSTKALTDAKKAEKIASLENEIALGKEAGSYDECKESIIAAFREGYISADECRDLLAKSMSEMSDDAQKTFMEDIPSDIRNGLDPNKFETTRKKLGDWLKGSFTRDWRDTFGPVLGGILNDFFLLVENLCQDIRFTFEGIQDFIDGVFSKDLELSLSGLVDLALGVFSNMNGILGSPFFNLLKTIKELGFAGAIEDLKQQAIQKWEDIKEKLSAPFDAVKEKVEDMPEIIKIAWKKGINSVIAIMNKFINWLNDSLSFIIPPITVMGKKIFDGKYVELAHIPQIPYLAKGAVIPPNAPFMAMLGDQRHGTNIEAPLSTIQEALANVLAEHGTGDVNVNISGDLAPFIRWLKVEVDKENRRVGGSLIKGGI